MMANVPAAVDIPGSAPQRPWWARVLRHFWSEHEAIKNHLTSFAIVIAGFWTYFIFTSLNQVKRAEAELAALRQEPVANIDITVSDVRLPGQGRLAMVVTTSVQNIGRRTAVLDFRNSAPLSVARLSYDPLRGLIPDPPMSFRILSVTGEADTELRAVGTLPKVSLLPGEHTKYEFIVPDLLPGVYLIQFSAPVAPTDVALNAPVPGSTSSNPSWYWVGRRFHVHAPSPRHARRAPSKP